MEQLDYFTLITSLLGGLALFLFGMGELADALKAVAGDHLKTILERLTRNRVMGLLTGAGVTAVIQSSSVTTVVVVGFISAGLMSLSQSIGIILGANIGTTITAQIVAFKVTKYALALIGVGFGVKFFSKKEQLQHHGAGMMGLGLVFFGMAVMGDAMAPLRSYPPFIEGMARMENPLLGILIGAAFTALVQSSSATSGVVIVLAGQGLITLPAGISLVLGANVGTCVTALLASIGRPREALRAAVAHVVFNVVGVLLWIGLIHQLAVFVSWMSPVSEAIAAGTDRLAADTPRQIANAHSVFNVVNALIFLPFATQLARAVEWLVPDRPEREEAAARARYLDTGLISTPAFALDRARMEIQHMGERVRDMLAAVLPAVLSGTRDSSRAVADMDNAIDALHGHIITYLGQISRQELTESQTHDLIKLMEAANDLENIGDVMETNLVSLAHQRIDSGVTPSPATQKLIQEFHALVSSALDASILAITERDVEAARRVVDMKSEINRLADRAARHERDRLVAAEPNRLPAYTIETDVLENLKRIYYFCKRMARMLAPSEQPPTPESMLGRS